MRIPILISLLCAFAGCSLDSPKNLAMWHYRQDPAKSTAMNVALATDLTDGHRGSLRDDHGDPRDLAAGDEQIRYGRTAAGLSASGADAAVDVETGLLGDPSPTDGQSTPHIYAFMPKRESGNGYTAASRLRGMVTRGMVKALALQGFRTRAGDPETDDAFTIVGGHCSENGIRCTGDAAFSYMPTNILSRSRWDGGIGLAEAPDFVGGGPVWFFRGYAGIGAIRDADHRQPGSLDNGEVDLADAGLDMTRLYRDMTRFLPAWVYIYDPDAGGRPAMFNQGQTLRFTAPRPHVLAKETGQHRG
jgi:hypothetical protein